MQPGFPQHPQQFAPQPFQPQYPDQMPPHIPYPAGPNTNMRGGGQQQSVTAEGSSGKKMNKKAKKREAALIATGQMATGTQMPTPPTLAEQKKDKGQKKIHLPAPKPTTEYFRIASEDSYAINPPNRILVILDLNGTLLFRPIRRRPTYLLERPFLKPFLRYLIQNFSVVVWSSAKPENVKAMVQQVLDEELRNMLVGCWGRDTFGLSPEHYTQNVQVYKDLRLIWNADEVQQKHPNYQSGKRWSQVDTILIDDSALKASAQPHNLIQIPEFVATPEQMEEDILREVAGYLDCVKTQKNASSWMRNYPFKAGAGYKHDWPDAMAEGGELKEQISLSKK